MVLTAVLAMATACHCTALRRSLLHADEPHKGLHAFTDPCLHVHPSSFHGHTWLLLASACLLTHWMPAALPAEVTGIKAGKPQVTIKGGVYGEFLKRKLIDRRFEATYPPKPKKGTISRLSISERRALQEVQYAWCGVLSQDEQLNYQPATAERQRMVIYSRVLTFPQFSAFQLFLTAETNMQQWIAAFPCMTGQIRQMMGIGVVYEGKAQMHMCKWGM